MNSFELRPFQEEGVRAIYNFRGRALLADDQGLGKTVQALSWIHRIPRRRPVLIITPASLKYMWQHEAWEKFRIRARVLEGTSPKMRVLKDDVLVINYDILHAWLGVLMRRPPDVVVMDECHFVKNRGSRRTKMTREVASEASSVVGLSGTPMTNKPVELWSILRIIRPLLFPSFKDYAWEYCDPRWSPRWGWRFDGAVKKEQLFTILKQECMIRRLKEDVAPELPAKIHKVIPLRAGPKKMAEYRKAEGKFIEWLRERSQSRAIRAAKALELVRVGYLLRLASELKMDMLVRFLRDLHEANPGSKIVGLTGHTEVIDRMSREFPRSVIVDGRVTGRLRNAAVRKFNDSSRVDWFFGNWRAAGTGLNLQKAHLFVSLDPPWTPGDLLQGQDRIHRIGQKNECLIHYPVLMETIEEKWMAILRERMEVLRDVLDGEREISGEDLFNKLLAGMKRR